MEYALAIGIAWLINTGLNLAFFNDPPPPPQHKICYEEVFVEESKRLVPYECLGGLSVGDSINGVDSKANNE